jgi:hypothetical protein
MLYIIFLLLLIAYFIALANFPKGSGDTSQNGQKVLDSRMLLHAAFQFPLTICKRLLLSHAQTQDRLA